MGTTDTDTDLINACTMANISAVASAVDVKALVSTRTVDMNIGIGVEDQVTEVLLPEKVMAQCMKVRRMAQPSKNPIKIGYLLVVMVAVQFVKKAGFRTCRTQNRIPILKLQMLRARLN